MAKLPVLSGDELIRLLKKAGFEIVRQKGSHASLQKGEFKTVVPRHDELAKGTLLGILKQCGLSREDLRELIEGSGFLIQYLSQLFGCLKYVSPVEWVRCISTCAKNSKSATEIYVLCWLVVELVFLVLLFIWPTISSTRGFFITAWVLFTLRLLDLMQVSFNTLIFDRIRSIQKGLTYERDPERWLLLNLMNYAEIIIIFGIFYSLVRDAFAYPINTINTINTVWQGFYHSVGIATLFGSNLEPKAWQGYPLFFAEIAYALLFIVLILGNAISQLGSAQKK